MGSERGFDERMYLELGQGERGLGEELDGQGHDGGGGLVTGDEEGHKEVDDHLVGEVVVSGEQGPQHVALRRPFLLSLSPPPPHDHAQRLRHLRPRLMTIQEPTPRNLYKAKRKEEEEERISYRIETRSVRFLMDVED